MEQQPKETKFLRVQYQNRSTVSRFALLAARKAMARVKKPARKRAEEEVAGGVEVVSAIMP